MSSSQSTAVATPFGSVPTIHNIQMNMIIKASLFKNLLTFIEWYPHNFSISFSSKRFEFLEFLNRNISIIFDSKFNDFTNHLSEICFDKIPFIIPDFIEFPFIIQ